MNVAITNDELLGMLACPEDQSSLSYSHDSYLCERGHRFLIEEGLPIFTHEVRRERTPSNMAPCARPIPEGPVDPFVNDWLVNTNGNLYWGARGNLRRYPIPECPLPPGEGRILLDVGCSWGRWTVAAARAGYRPIGIDVHLDALAAASRVCRQLGLQARFLCCGAEKLPFRTASVDASFSYSVLQHLDRATVCKTLLEFSRVLKPGGSCLIQLPNRHGLVSTLQQARRGFREAAAGTFEMRYWSMSEIRDALRRASFRDLRVRVDGYFSQNPQLSDLDLLSPVGRLVVRASHAARQLAKNFPLLARTADSLWIEGHAAPAGSH
ncbi:MAG TPA: class I SAM-dependent methyltransferase [Candidatus Acidoferrales bacterium]|nr:class I SAM-dependent methyltransferase [Candidatus Acidoferrales bacterium]